MNFFPGDHHALGISSRNLWIRGEIFSHMFEHHNQLCLSCGFRTICCGRLAWILFQYNLATDSINWNTADRWNGCVRVDCGKQRFRLIHRWILNKAKASSRACGKIEQQEALFPKEPDSRSSVTIFSCRLYYNNQVSAENGRLTTHSTTSSPSSLERKNLFACLGYR